MGALTRIPKLLRQLKVRGKATQAEVDTGTNDTEFVTPLRLAGMTGNLTAPDFTSSEQTVTVDTLLDVAHGLSARPILVTVSMRFTTAEHGYSIGDEIPVGTPLLDSGSADGGCTIAVDATNVTLVQGAFFRIHVQSTFNFAVLTTTNVRWIVRAWL